MSRYYRDAISKSTPLERLHPHRLTTSWVFLLAIVITGALYGLSLNLDNAVPPTSLHDIARTWHLFVATAALTWVAYSPLATSRGSYHALLHSLVLLSVGPGINWVTYLLTDGTLHARGLDLTGGVSLVTLATNGLGVVLLTVVAVKELRASLRQ